MRPGPGGAGVNPVLLVGLVVLVALVVGASVGSGIGSVLSASSAETGAVPPVPQEFPGNSKRYLQGVAVSPVTQAWQQAATPPGTCEPNTDETRVSGAAQLMVCRVGSLARLRVEYDDETNVRQVDVYCQAGPGSPDCQNAFVLLAGLALPGDPGLQQQAKDWAAANVDSDLDTTIGPVHLEVRLEPHRITALPAV